MKYASALSMLNIRVLKKFSKLNRQKQHEPAFMQKPLSWRQTRRRALRTSALSLTPPLVDSSPLSMKRSSVMPTHSASSMSKNSDS